MEVQKRQELQGMAWVGSVLVHCYAQLTRLIFKHRISPKKLILNIKKKEKRKIEPELQRMAWVGAVQLVLVQRPGPLLQSTQNALSTCRKMALSRAKI